MKKYIQIKLNLKLCTQNVQTLSEHLNVISTTPLSSVGVPAGHVDHCGVFRDAAGQVEAVAKGPVDEGAVDERAVGQGAVDRHEGD